MGRSQNSANQCEAASDRIDLPFTVGILAGSGQLVSDKFDDYAVVGELALDSSMRPAKGALSMVIAATTLEKKLRGLIVPQENAGEAAVVSGVASRNRRAGGRHIVAYGVRTSALLCGRALAH